MNFQIAMNLLLTACAHAHLVERDGTVTLILKETQQVRDLDETYLGCARDFPCAGEVGAILTRLFVFVAAAGWIFPHTFVWGCPEIARIVFLHLLVDLASLVL